MKHFLIYTNLHKDRDLAVTEHIREFLEQKGCTVSVITESQTSEEKVISKQADCMLVLGGDGTILRAARQMGELNIPILGVNMGTLGYLTEVEPDNIDSALTQLLAGEAQPEERMTLCAQIKSPQGQGKEQWALNDVVITRSGPLQINDFNIYVNGQFLKKYSADGIIISTPTGSTGYNLSAGGPIAKPGTRLMLITPICPHTFNQRSIILSSEDRIVVEIPEGRNGQQEVEVSFDGGSRTGLRTGDSIAITGCERNVVFLKLSKASFLEVLRRKMSENSRREQ
ncbi:MAG: NAD(+)/NADH kinase [Lachnospiraceae bacterium]|nr:NAD(+)/NADH kinase [Lachnospiraceae bacterium]